MPVRFVHELDCTHGLCGLSVTPVTHDIAGRISVSEPDWLRVSPNNLFRPSILRLGGSPIRRNLLAPSRVS